MISHSSDDLITDTYDVFTIRGDDNGTRLFEFLAENVTKQTSVEISHAKTGLSGNKGLNFISSRHTLPMDNGQRESLVCLFCYRAACYMDIQLES